MNLHKIQTKILLLSKNVFFKMLKKNKRNKRKEVRYNGLQCCSVALSSLNDHWDEERQGKKEVKILELRYTINIL